MFTEQEIIDLFMKGFNCAQVLTETWGKQLGYDQEILLKSCSAFAVGMSQGETCGAIIAAYILIGLKYGYSTSDEQGGIAKINTMKVQTQFRELFLKSYNSTMCRELLHADIRTKAGREKFAQDDPINNFCPKLIITINNILNDILLD